MPPRSESISIEGSRRLIVLGDRYLGLFVANCPIAQYAFAPIEANHGANGDDSSSVARKRVSVS